MPRLASRSASARCPEGSACVPESAFAPSGNRNATRGRFFRRRTPSASPAADSSAAASARFAATTARRQSSSERPVRSVDATSARLGPSASFRASPTAAARRFNDALRASGSAAETIKSSGRTVSGSCDGPASTAGAASRIVCALVPDHPNELTPATSGRSLPDSSRGRSEACAHGRTTVLARTASAGSARFRFAGARPCWSTSTVLIRPAIPAAAWVWPMLVFTAPTGSGAARPPNTSPSAPSSISSPSGVPEPCASTYARSAGSACAAARARRITSTWAPRFGAVRPLLRPSWFTAEPRITAWMRRPSRSASDRRSSTTRPPPSPSR